MNAKLTGITIAMIAMVAMTGFAAAMDTNVQYKGDGAYNARFTGSGTGYLGIHTFMSQGEDHSMTTWTNTNAFGTQSMDQVTTSHNFGPFQLNRDETVIVRDITVGTRGYGQNASGEIVTVTIDNDNNSIVSRALYRDDEAWTSHVTTDQTVKFVDVNGSFRNSYDYEYLSGQTSISGHAYGANTLVSGLVRTITDGTYTYVVVEMDNGKFAMDVYSHAATHQNYKSLTLVDVDAKGEGIFATGTGNATHYIGLYMVDDDGTTTYTSYGNGVTVDTVTTFDGNFDAWGYLYAFNMTAPSP